MAAGARVAARYALDRQEALPNASSVWRRVQLQRVVCSSCRLSRSPPLCLPAGWTGLLERARYLHHGGHPDEASHGDPDAVGGERGWDSRGAYLEACRTGVQRALAAAGRRLGVGRALVWPRMALDRVRQGSAESPPQSAQAAEADRRGRKLTVLQATTSAGGRQGDEAWRG